MIHSYSRGDLDGDTAGHSYQHLGFRFVGILAFGNPLLRVTVRVLPNLLRACTVYLMDGYLEHKARTARTEHTCAAPRGECDGTIRPGERYFDEVAAPWTQIADDVDDDGHVCYTTLDEWHHTRTHVSCYNAWQDFNREVRRPVYPNAFQRSEAVLQAADWQRAQERG